MDISNKDIYENIINFADDRTILQMLSANKKFNDPIFFERVFDRKYPLLKRFKRKNESWRRFFVRMTYYIAKLDEEFGIPYIPTKGYNPEGFYKLWNKDSKRIYDFAMYKAAKGGHLEIVQYLIDEKGADDFNYAMKMAASKGRLEIVKYLLEKGAREVNDAMIDAAYRDHLDIVKYLIEKGADSFKAAMVFAARRNHHKVVEYLKQFS